MSLPEPTDFTIPDETIALARRVCPSPSVPMLLRDALGPIYADFQFAPLFAAQGRPAEAPARLALVCMLQFLENLTDRQAADAVRLRIDWKYALALPLDDTGFCHTVLTDFRERLLSHNAEGQLLEHLLLLCASKGWLNTRRQRTDSTQVLAAIRFLNRIELVGETLRATLNLLAQAAPDWLQSVVPLVWYERYTHRIEASRFPASKTARTALAQTIAEDGAELLKALWQPSTPSWLRELPAVSVLRQVWLQQFLITPRGWQMREEGDLPPGSVRIVSPYDPEARSGVKRSLMWDGYKVHLTETVSLTQPQLITQVETTNAAETDHTALPRIQQALVETKRKPEEHLLDAGYISVDQLEESRKRYQIDCIAPLLENTSWQSQAGKGYAVQDFKIVWDQEYAICPQNQCSTSWSCRNNHRTGVEEVLIRFPTAVCRACPVRGDCTTAQQMGRTLTVRPEAKQQLIDWGRERQTTPAFKEIYSLRAGIEGTLAQAIRANGLRRSRYRGKVKTHLQHILVAVAINVARISDWWSEKVRARTRTSTFATLAPKSALSA